MPGRPIISANESPTERISEFVDHFLNPTTFDLPAYVKDTTDFLNKLNELENIPDNALLVTLDVESLYTNIPHNYGIEAAKATLNKARPHSGLKPSNDSLLTLLKLVLTKNNFQFNGNNFLQISGTAMGTKLAVGYANNALGKFEKDHIYTYHLQPLIYLRFIDDIFMIWTHGIDKLHDFITHINSCTEHFKFTKEISPTMVTFLDTKVTLNNSKITTNLYQKPTDSHNYLMYDSSHPQSCKDSIPYSQFLRIRRICSEESDFTGHCLNLCRHFRRRGYPVKLLEEALFQAQQRDRKTLLAYKPKNEKKENTLYLTTTYHPHNSLIRDIVKNNWDILGKNNTTDFLHKKKLICGYRRPKNLRDTLMRAKVPPLKGDETLNPFLVPTPERQPIILQAPSKQKSIKDFFKTSDKRVATPQLAPTTSSSTPNLGPRRPRGFKFCNTKNCRYCPLLDKTGTITCKGSSENYYTMTNISCRSSNLIYCITCKRCKIQYVGQTSKRIKDRFVGHFYDTQKNAMDKPVPLHFNSDGHFGTKDMIISILEFVKKPPQTQQAQQIRLRRETHWVHTLRTLSPHGLNWENPKEFKLKNRLNT